MNERMNERKINWNKLPPVNGVPWTRAYKARLSSNSAIETFAYTCIFKLASGLIKKTLAWRHGDRWRGW